MTLKGMTLRGFIFMQFKYYYHGKGRPIRRATLLWKTTIEPEFRGTTDREMRQAYEDLPICGSSKGLYLPETKGEIDEQRDLN